MSKVLSSRLLIQQKYSYFQKMKKFLSITEYSTKLVNVTVLTIILDYQRVFVTLDKKRESK